MTGMLLAPIELEPGRSAGLLLVHWDELGFSSIGDTLSSLALALRKLRILISPLILMHENLINDAQIM
jgi:hypothetical protein